MCININNNNNKYKVLKRMECKTSLIHNRFAEHTSVQLMGIHQKHLLNYKWVIVPKAITEHFRITVKNAVIWTLLYSVITCLTKAHLSLRVAIPLCMCDKYCNISTVKHNSCIYLLY
jgi:hypothetical protein